MPYHGQAALQLLAQERFDVIIMDVMMPRLDGLRTVGAAACDGIATPVLFSPPVTAWRTSWQAFGRGDDHLVKPFAMEELEVRLEAPRPAWTQRGHGRALLWRSDGGSPASGRATPRRVELKLGKIRSRSSLLVKRAPAGDAVRVLDTVWGDEGADSDALRSHIYAPAQRPRQTLPHPMLGDPARPGYRLVTP